MRISSEKKLLTNENALFVLKRPEFSETPNPAYFYAYFCFCTRKISLRGFSFTLYCHRTSKLNFKDVPRTSEISFVRRNRYPRCPKNCQKARPLLTSCMMFAPPTYWKFATCVGWALRTSHFPLAGVLLTSVSSVTAPFWWLSFIDIGVKRRGTLLMAAWSLCVFVTRAELINLCLHN